MKKKITFLLFLGILSAITSCGKVKNSGNEIQLDHEEIVVESNVKADNCFICKIDDYESDRLGLIHWNGMKMVEADLGIDSENNKREASIMQMIGMGGDYGTVVSETDISRGMAQISVEMTERDLVDFSSIQETLCQKCLDQVLHIYDEQVEFGEEEHLASTGYALVDFKTKGIYPLSDPYRQYYIRDYYVRYDIANDMRQTLNFNLEILYLPKK